VCHDLQLLSGASIGLAVCSGECIVARDILELLRVSLLSMGYDSIVLTPFCTCMGKGGSSRARLTEKLATSILVKGVLRSNTAFSEVRDTGTVMFVHLRAEAAATRVKRANVLIMMMTM
jgi:hypothetical protein